jgi:hypothetical protein
VAKSIVAAGMTSHISILVNVASKLEEKEVSQVQKEGRPASLDAA